MAIGPTPCMAASSFSVTPTERLDDDQAGGTQRAGGRRADRPGERRALGAGRPLAPPAAEPVDDDLAAGRQAVPDRQRLGQPQLLELAHVGLERRGLAADLRGQVGCAPLGVAVDEVERRPRPGAVRRRAVEALEPGDDRGDLVLAWAPPTRSSARGSAPACRSPTRHAGLSAFGSSAATRAASDGEPARRASSSVSDSTATSDDRGHLDQPDAGAHLRPHHHARPVPAAERQVDPAVLDRPELARPDHHEAGVSSPSRSCHQAVSTQAPNFQPTSSTTPTWVNPHARCSRSLRLVRAARSRPAATWMPSSRSCAEQLVVQPPAEALLPGVEAEVHRDLARLLVRRPVAEDRRLGVPADLAVLGDHDQQVLAPARLVADLRQPSAPGRATPRRTSRPRSERGGRRSPRPRPGRPGWRHGSACPHSARSINSPVLLRGCRHDERRADHARHQGLDLGPRAAVPGVRVRRLDRGRRRPAAPDPRQRRRVAGADGRPGGRRPSGTRRVVARWSTPATSTTCTSSSTSGSPR